MRWERHVGHMGDRNAYEVSVRNPEGKGPLGILRCRREDNIRMNLKELDCEGVEWIQLA
jgi:hypothetical protein